MKTSSNKRNTKTGSAPKAKSDLQSMPMPELQAKLGTSPDGLTQAEAAKRLVQYGPNEIEEKEDNPSSIVARRSWLG
jgi:H+-transporting ATPase